MGGVCPPQLCGRPRSRPGHWLGYDDRLPRRKDSCRQGVRHRHLPRHAARRHDRSRIRGQHRRRRRQPARLVGEPVRRRQVRCGRRSRQRRPVQLRRVPVQLRRYAVWHGERLPVPRPGKTAFRFRPEGDGLLPRGSAGRRRLRGWLGHQHLRQPVPRRNRDRPRLHGRLVGEDLLELLREPVRLRSRQGHGRRWLGQLQREPRRDLVRHASLRLHHAVPVRPGCPQQLPAAGHRASLHLQWRNPGRLRQVRRGQDDDQGERAHRRDLHGCRAGGLECGCRCIHSWRFHRRQDANPRLPPARQHPSPVLLHLRRPPLEGRRLLLGHSHDHLQADCRREHVSGLVRHVYQQHDPDDRQRRSGRVLVFHWLVHRLHCRCPRLWQGQCHARQPGA